MTVRMRDLVGGAVGRLRYEPTAKRVRAEADGVVVALTDRALLVWEPRRVVPAYAVPREDLRGTLAPAPAPPPDVPAGTGFAVPDVTELRVLDPRVPFSVRSTPGEPVAVRVPGSDRVVEGFCPADPALAGYVVLDFDGCDAWYEEDEPLHGHPRDPFHRVDVRAGSRSVRVSAGGQLLAASSRPRLVFETLLPVRWYLPAEDVVADLVPSETRTWCAYKGQAEYWSVRIGDGLVPDAVWSYRDPLPDAAGLRGLLCFFDERFDVAVDGVPRPRPVTPWS
ncbi:DUF427 domain-containing protein [Geodermatophilus sp. SYSU D00698]